MRQFQPYIVLNTIMLDQYVSVQKYTQTTHYQKFRPSIKENISKSDIEGNKILALIDFPNKHDMDI